MRHAKRELESVIMGSRRTGTVRVYVYDEVSDGDADAENYEVRGVISPSDARYWAEKLIKAADEAESKG